jgi:hypothetical protein
MSSTDGWGCTDASYTIDELFEQTSWPAQIWYYCVVSIALLNAGVYLSVRMRPKGSDDDDDRVREYRQTMGRLAGMYVFISLYRTVFPTTFAGRFVWHDSVFSSILLARCLATVAELSFVGQIALATQFCAQELLEARRGAESQEDAEHEDPQQGALHHCTWHGYTQRAPKAMLGWVVLAECFSLCGVITGNRRWFVFDQCCWCLAMLVIIPACFHILRSARQLARGRPSRRCCSAATAETFALCALVLSVLYVAWIVKNSVPIWWSRLEWQEANEVPVFSIHEGLWDALTFRVQTHSWAIWWRVVVWLPFCLTLVSWSSIAMSLAPQVRPQRPESRQEEQPVAEDALLQQPAAPALGVRPLPALPATAGKPGSRIESFEFDMNDPQLDGIHKCSWYTCAAKRAYM